MDTILTINAGSSSIKFELFEVAAGLQRRFRGQLDGIGTPHPHLAARDHEGKSIADRIYEASEVRDARAAQNLIGAWLDEHQGGPPSAVGHRVVHGGATFAG